MTAAEIAKQRLAESLSWAEDDDFETSASISPVFGSIATTEPFWSPRASHAAFCTPASIVSSTAAPLGFCPVMMLLSLSRNCALADPLR